MAHEYRFEIDALTPETLSLGRLIAYLEELKKLMGNEPGLHFSGVEKGSAVLKMWTDPPTGEKVWARIDSVTQGDAPADVRKGYDELNDLLRKDGAEAIFRVDGAEIIKFPGRNLPAPERIGPIRQSTSIEGQLVKIGGRDQSVHFTVIDGKRAWNGETNRTIARNAAQYLFGPTLRFSGDGKWFREADGQWTLNHFRAGTFTVLDDAPVDEALAKLRAAVEFVPDAMDIIRDLREDGE